MRVFCFVKQKTAYEMRISDWSSDVCSSDLIDELDPYARVEESELAIAVLELFEIELGDILERVGRGAEGDARALLARGRRAVDLERRDRIAMFEAPPMPFANAPDLALGPLGHGVDERGPAPLQPPPHPIA